MTDPALTHFPTPVNHKAFEVGQEVRIAKIAEKFHQILEILGLDLNYPSFTTS